MGNQLLSFLPSFYFLLLFSREEGRERERGRENLDFLEQATFTRSLIYALGRLLIRAVASPRWNHWKKWKAARRKGRGERMRRRRVGCEWTTRARRGTVARPTLRRSNFDPCRTRFPFCLCTRKFGTVHGSDSFHSPEMEPRWHATPARKRVVAPPIHRRLCRAHFRPSFHNRASPLSDPRLFIHVALLIPSISNSYVYKLLTRLRRHISRSKEKNRHGGNEKLLCNARVNFFSRRDDNEAITEVLRCRIKKKFLRRTKIINSIRILYESSRGQRVEDTKNSFCIAREINRKKKGNIIVSSGREKQSCIRLPEKNDGRKGRKIMYGRMERRKKRFDRFVDESDRGDFYGARVDSDRTPASRRLPQLGASILVSKGRISADRGRGNGNGPLFSRGHVLWSSFRPAGPVFFTAPVKIVSRNYLSSPGMELDRFQMEPPAALHPPR